jgi:hypothetical protein
MNRVYKVLKIRKTISNIYWQNLEKQRLTISTLSLKEMNLGQGKISLILQQELFLKKEFV